jgi:hypothetical protein
MNTIISSRLLQVVFLVVVVLVPTSRVSAYPPSNAAVLYYRTFMIMEHPDEAKRKMLYSTATCRIGLSRETKDYVHQWRNHVIDPMVTAAEIPNCDWGFDYSQGHALRLPHIGHFRFLVSLILADAQIFAENGDYEQALRRCLTAVRMGHHVSEGPSLCFFTGIGVVDMANKSIQGLLGKMPQDPETLKWLKNELVRAESRAFPFESCMAIDFAITGVHMQRETGEKIIGTDFGQWAQAKLPELAAARARKAPEEFFAENQRYWENYTSSAQAALKLPYPDAFFSLKKLSERSQRDAGKPEAALTALFVGASVLT